MKLYRHYQIRDELRWSATMLWFLGHHLSRDLAVPHVQRYMDDSTLMAIAGPYS